MLIYVQGSALNRIEKKATVIAHICNDVGVWGAGFVMALSSRWTEPQFMYLAEFMKPVPPKLGETIWTPVEYGVVVANMIAQQGVKPRPSNLPLVNYFALNKTLDKVGDFCVRSKAVVQMPRIGCGIGGGDWNVVEGIIQDKLVKKGVRVYVCDLPEEEKKWPGTKYALSL